MRNIYLSTPPHQQKHAVD